MVYLTTDYRPVASNERMINEQLTGKNMGAKGDGLI
jgi:hypothetical protein